MKENKIAVYPGSFDPLTNGHLDIIIRASKIFDKVIVGVLSSHFKPPVFTMEQRVSFIKKTTENLPNVEALGFNGLLVNFAKENKASIILKGLRAVSDFEYEFQMALANRNQVPEIETMFLTTSTEYMFLSSSVVRELAKYNGNLDGLVPNLIKNDILDKLKK